MRLGKFSILATGYLACYEYVGSKYSGTRISHVLPPISTHAVPTYSRMVAVMACRVCQALLLQFHLIQALSLANYCITFRFYYCKLSKFGVRSSVGIITLFREWKGGSVVYASLFSLLIQCCNNTTVLHVATNCEFTASKNRLILGLFLLRNNWSCLCIVKTVAIFWDVVLCQLARFRSCMIAKVRTGQSST